MHFDSFMHISFCFRTSNTCRHTAWQVGRIGRIVTSSLFNDDTDAIHSFCPLLAVESRNYRGGAERGTPMSQSAYRRVCGAATPKGAAQRGCSVTGPPPYSSPPVFKTAYHVIVHHAGRL